MSAVASFTGLAPFMAEITRISQASRNMGPFKKKSSAYQLTSLQTNFLVRGRPRWAWYKPSTLRRMYGPQRLLIKTGQMMGSNRVRMTSTGWRIINVDKKSIYHLLGTHYMAQRTWMLFQKEDERVIFDMFKQHFIRR